MQFSIKPTKATAKAIKAIRKLEQDTRKEYAYAVNGAGIELRKRLTRRMQTRLSKLSPQSRRALRYGFASPKRNPIAGRLFILDWAWQYLKWPLEGGKQQRIRARWLDGQGRDSENNKSFKEYADYRLHRTRRGNLLAFNKYTDEYEGVWVKVARYIASAGSFEKSVRRDIPVAVGEQLKRRLKG